MLLPDHFVISFNLSLRKPVREKRKQSQEISVVTMHVFWTDVPNLLGSATQSNSTDPSVFIARLHQLLDRHARLVSHTVTDGMPAPWMTLEIKQAREQSLV